MKKTLKFITLITTLFSPFLVFGAIVSDKCGQVVDGVMSNPCNFNDLMILVNSVIDFLLFTIATPLAAIVFAYAGFNLLTSGGDTGKLTQAKSMIKNVLIGYVIALAAWLIINTILNTLGFEGSFLTQ